MYMYAEKIEQCYDSCKTVIWHPSFSTSDWAFMLNSAGIQPVRWLRA